MRYQKVKWLHEFPDEPVWIYEEIDDEGFERRKVEIFRDGSTGIAQGAEETYRTRLASEPVPSLAEIGADPQFEPTEISQEEFERLWAQAQVITEFPSNHGGLRR